MEKPIAIDSEIGKLTALVVEYCPICSLCLEYCQFSSLHSNQQVNEEKITTKPEGLVEIEGDLVTDKKVVIGEGVPEKPKKEKHKQKIQSIKILLHEKKGRTLTLVSGFEEFEISGKDVSKKLTKRFGCGSGSVTTDGFELQGGFNEQLIEFLLDEFQGLLTEKNFEVEEKLEKKNKKKIKPTGDDK